MKLFKAVSQSTFCLSFEVAVDMVSSEYPPQSVIKVVNTCGDTLLHAAVRSAETRSKDIMNWLAQNHPQLIVEKNDAGDTALHLAAKAGNTETIQVLLQCYAQLAPQDRIPTLIGRVKNGWGNTVLHEAMSRYSCHAKYGDAVEKLVSADPETAYIQNSKGESPLYLAVEAGVKVEMLNHLLGNPSTPRLPEGQSPVHAAIKYKRYDYMLQILRKRPELIGLTDENGRRALHCAAETDYLEAIKYISQNFPSEISERDNEGMYPLHVACESGNVKAYQALRSAWPDPTEFLDNNYQNILHIAAKNGRESVVRCIVKDPNLGPKVLNMEDKDGNTPLHLAAMNGHSLVVGTLVLNRNCNSQILNVEGLTPYGIAKIRAEVDEGSEEQNSVCIKEKRKQPNSKKSHAPDSAQSMMTLSVLFVLHLLKTICRQKPQKISSKSEIKLRRVDKKLIENRVTGLFVVAGLVAAAAFSGALQIPSTGADETVGPNNNSTTTNHATARWWWSISSSKQPVEGKQVEIYLRVFIFLDTVALNLAIMAAIILCWVQLVDVNLASFFVWVASLIVGFSLYTLCLAFGFALLLGLKNNASFGVGTIMMEGLFLTVTTALVVPLFIPFGYNYLLVRALYFPVFIAYFVLKRPLVHTSLFKKLVDKNLIVTRRTVTQNLHYVLVAELPEHFHFGPEFMEALEGISIEFLDGNGDAVGESGLVDESEAAVTNYDEKFLVAPASSGMEI
ncbi:hypothetical protein SLA2020_374130 [Shorea laevis]